MHVHIAGNFFISYEARGHSSQKDFLYWKPRGPRVVSIREGDSGVWNIMMKETKAVGKVQLLTNLRKPLGFMNSMRTSYHDSCKPSNVQIGRSSVLQGRVSNTRSCVFLVLCLEWEYVSQKKNTSLRRCLLEEKLFVRCDGYRGFL